MECLHINILVSYSSALRNCDKKNLNEINIFLVFASENYSKHATRDVKMFESKTNNQIKTKTIKSVEISLLDYNEYVFI